MTAYITNPPAVRPQSRALSLNPVCSIGADTELKLHREAAARARAESPRTSRAPDTGCIAKPYDFTVNGQAGSMSAGLGIPRRYTAVMQPVSVVVTELNEIQDIGRGVSGLLAQEPAAAEVIVVDGGSTDGTWEWLEAANAREPRLVAIRDEMCSLK